jgi:hypothetical protein
MYVDSIVDGHNWYSSTHLLLVWPRQTILLVVVVEFDYGTGVLYHLSGLYKNKKAANENYTKCTTSTTTCLQREHVYNFQYCQVPALVVPTPNFADKWYCSRVRFVQFFVGVTNGV